MFDALHVFPEDPARGNYNDKNTYNEIDIFGSKRGKEKCWQLVVLSRRAIQRGHVLKKIEIKMRSTRHFGWEGPENEMLIRRRKAHEELSLSVDENARNK